MGPAFQAGQAEVWRLRPHRQTGGLLSLGASFLNRIPILWTVAVGIALIGAIYYLAVGRRKEFAPVIAPAGDDAPLVAAAPPGTAAPPEE